MQRLLRFTILFVLPVFFLSSCETSDTPVNVRIPQVVTKSVDRITSASVVVTAEIAMSGASAITASGICWSETRNPTIDDNTTEDGLSGVGKFTSTLTDLTPGTQYYVRAYATNSNGTGYGEEQMVKTLEEIKMIQIKTSATILAKGIRQEFKAMATFYDNTVREITKVVEWSSSDETVAMIDVNGVVKAYSEGSVIIRASVDYLETAVDVQVVPAQVIQLTITPGNLESLMPGKTGYLKAQALYTDSTTTDITNRVTWSSSDVATATISAAGVINTVAVGTTTFSARFEGITASHNFSVKLTLGEFYAGGYIFYIDATGKHGMVAASSDQSDGVTWWIGPTWVYSDDPSFTPNETVGAGPGNTATIVAIQGNGRYAAKICDELVLEGYDDWFLPSIGELELMCQNLYQNKIGNLSDLFYWSSTDISKRTSACWMQFSNGCQRRTDFGRDQQNRVRAARKF